MVRLGCIANLAPAMMKQPTRTVSATTGSTLAACQAGEKRGHTGDQRDAALLRATKLSGSKADSS